MEPPRRHDLHVAAGFGAGFEEIEQGAVLEQELLAAEGKRTLACRAVRQAVDRRNNRGLVEKRRRRSFDTGARCSANEHSAHWPPITDKGSRGAQGTTLPLRLR